MPEIADIINIASLSVALAQQDIAKAALYGPVMDNNLADKIQSMKDSVSWAYGQDTNYPGITEAAAHLYSLCGGYGVKAYASLGIPAPVDSNSVVVVVSNIFPLYKTSAAFTTATFYPDTRLFGNQISVFFNQLNRFLTQGEFTVDPTGLTITLAGFNAITNSDYEIWIYKVNA